MKVPSSPHCPALQSAAMKFSLIAAVVLLALAQGSFAQDAADLEKLGQYIEDMKNRMTSDLTELFRHQDLTNQAQAFLQDKRTQLEPLATQVQEKMKTVATSVEEHIRPLAANVQEQIQAQVQPMILDFQKQVEALFQKLTEQTEAIGN
ncbi:type-4 ice-structuring protein LS-12-like [Brachyistius frenatus]|uniref:type-4 ice-structuring protein LS-12-like n=1 Tax=Brachyistius frenatus TaxID=100188 RepID=UPI0037E88923